MRHLTLILLATFLTMSCGQSDSKQKELELKEKELALKEKELELKEKANDQNVPEPASTNTQSDVSESPVDNVTNIDAEVRRINSLSLTKKSFQFTDNCHQPFTIEYLLSGNEIVKIIAKSEMQDPQNSEVRGSITHTLYYHKEKFMLYTQDFERKGGPAPTKEKLSEYAYDDKIIKLIRNNKPIQPENDNISPGSMEYQIYNAYSTQNFNDLFCS